MKKWDVEERRREEEGREAVQRVGEQTREDCGRVLAREAGGRRRRGGGVAWRASSALAGFGCSSGHGATAGQGTKGRHGAGSLRHAMQPRRGRRTGRQTGRLFCFFLLRATPLLSISAARRTWHRHPQPLSLPISSSGQARAAQATRKAKHATQGPRRNVDAHPTTWAAGARVKGSVCDKTSVTDP